MRRTRPLQLTFRAKVLLPVVSVMVVLAVVPLALVTNRMSRQFEAEAAENLLANEALFKNHQALREKNLILRYRNVPNEPRFKAVVQLADPKTTEAQLKELLDELGGDIISYVNAETSVWVSVSRDARFKPDPLAERCVDVVHQALAGQPAADTISVGAGDELFEVVSIPVSVGSSVLGALTIANEIGEAVAEEFTRLTRSEIILLSDGRIAVSSIRRPDLESQLKEALLFSESSVRPARSDKGPSARRVTLQGEHFLYARGQLGRPRAEDRVNYILLSSYEKPLGILQATERTFLWIQLLGILAGTTIVWWLIHRVTQPLHQLRDCAEAVGQGDFTRRIEVNSRDEFGALAAGFNRMTANLETSRAELETTIGALRSTQAQLIQSEKMRAIGTLAGGIAHDFNNILGAILGYTELVLDDVPAGSRTDRNLRHVLNASHRAKDLVRQILAFSRQSEPQRSNVRLSAIIDETFKLLRASIPTTIGISQQINTTADHVTADPTQLHQVLMNLGTNASHAMREKGGTLLITLDDHTVPESGTDAGEGPQLSAGPWLRVSVADTGHGMDQAVLERIFEPFFTTKPIGEGTGLGLSVVHGIIKNHGGEITVTSRRGEGTTFQIFLPRAEAADAASSQSGEVVRGHHERILVVDDEESLANMMHQKLTRLGYDVLACHDSVHALGMIRAAPQNFDLVVSDQTMPRLTGSDLAKEISRLELPVPVILCSGSPNGLPKPGEDHPNVRGCVLKPVNFTDLSRTIHRVLHETKRP
jgi:signal transduction histidine kinase